MTFEVEVGGRTFTVAVERTDRAGRFRVELDGVPRLIDVSRTGDFGLSLLVMGTVPLPGSEQGTVPLSQFRKRGTVPFFPYHRALQP